MKKTGKTFHIFSRRSFITAAIAGLGVALLPKRRNLVNVTEPKALTVKEWAETHRVEKWEPLETSIMPLPAGDVYMLLPGGWKFLGFTPGGKAEFRGGPLSLSQNSSDAVLSFGIAIDQIDEADS